MMNIKKLLLLILCFYSSLAKAQQIDSMQIIGEFMRVCNDYKQSSMQLEIEFKRTTNFITNEEDTANILARFYIQPTQSYLRFGEIEEIINDSIALIISDHLRSMLVYSNPTALNAYINKMMSLPFQDSTLSAIANKYQVSLIINNDSIHSIQLQARKFLHATSLPKDEITIEYNNQTHLPLKVNAVTRSLVLLNQEDYQLLSNQSAMKTKLVVDINGEYNCVIKELTSTFNYSKIDYNKNIQPPVLANDRIIKINAGIYKPVEAYRSYSIKTLN